MSPEFQFSRGTGRNLYRQPLQLLEGAYLEFGPPQGLFSVRILQPNARLDRFPIRNEGKGGPFIRVRQLNAQFDHHPGCEGTPPDDQAGDDDHHHADSDGNRTLERILPDDQTVDEYPAQIEQVDRRYNDRVTQKRKLEPGRIVTLAAAGG